MTDVQSKFWNCIGGETQLKLPGDWQVVDVIRQIQSPYQVSHRADPSPLTIITFNYPCLPREGIIVKVKETTNGIERAQDAIKTDTKITKT